jgi:hypothetical protein
MAGLVSAQSVPLPREHHPVHITGLSIEKKQMTAGIR